MEPKEQNRKALERGIKDMKQHTAPDFLWSAIEKEIKLPDEINKDFLVKAINQLPKHNLEKDLWTRIENNIEKGKKRRIALLKGVLEIAASILLLIGISIFVKQQIQHRGVIEISTAIIEENLFQSESFLKNCSTNQKEIDQICSAQPENCNTPLVEELKNQLNEVNKNYEELKSTIINNSNPELIKYLERIENEKCKIENELLTLIINS